MFKKSEDASEKVMSTFGEVEHRRTFSPPAESVGHILPLMDSGEIPDFLRRAPS
jgi:hypothetical protein